MELPSTQPHQETEEEEEEEEEVEEEEEKEEEGSVHPLASGLVTLSLLPKSCWCTLQNLDII